MGLMRRALILSLALGVAAESLTDSEAATMAKAAVADRCQDGFIGDFDETDDREALEATLGGDNFVLDILIESNSSSDVEENAMEYLQDDGIALIRRRAVGFVMFTLMLLLFPCFCVTACPCCERCRVCRPREDPRKTNVLLKLLFIAAVAAVGIGIFICWGYAFAAHAKMADGVDNLGCTSAKIVQTALEGQESPRFIGMNGMVDDFQRMTTVLDDNSQFMMDLNMLLDDTQDIETSVELATETLKLLSDVLQLPANSRPGGYHTCHFCTVVGQQVSPTVDRLEASLGALLAQARSEAKEQLNGPNRADMKKLLNESIQPTLDMKEQISKSFEPLVDSENWEQVQLVVDKGGLVTAMFLVAEAAVLAAIGLCAAGCFLVREGDHVGGYNRAVHRSACCVWVLAWLLCLSCFMWGGMLEVLAVPMSSVCLVLDDVNGNMIRDVRNALELDIDPRSDEFVMVTDAVDKCLNPPDRSVPANMADIFFYRDENGTKVTMRDQLQTQVEDSIMVQFDAVSKMIADNTQTNLENDPEVVQFRALLSTTAPGMSGMIMTNKTAIEDSGESWASSLTTMWPGYVSSVRCGDYTPAGAPMANPGIATYATTEESSNGVSLSFPNPPCPGIGDGTSIGTDDCSSATQADWCTADNFLLNKKYEVVTDPIFRCDVFETDSGAACDIKDMRQTNAQLNIWSNDCLRADKTLKRKEVQCTLEQFTDYIAGFDERIQNTMARVDATTGGTAGKINGDMRNLLMDQVISPFRTIIDGIQCNWLAEYYQETVWGVCYQGVGGMTKIGAVYVGLGFLLVLLIVIMYALWRRAVDNVKLRDARMLS